MIEKNPLKSNLCFAVKYIDKNLPIESAVSFVINEVRHRQDNAQGTLIYCRTRKQCSHLYKAISSALGIALFKGSEENPKLRLVEMYHAGTPEAVKSHILETVTNPTGHIRVLICTIAFGMGIDCCYMTRVIHFGGSKCIESYLQECGRAGRRGERSLCILIHNGQMLKYSDEDIKLYVHSTNCRRKDLLAAFSKVVEEEVVTGCRCCDICAQNCLCSDNSKCLLNLNLFGNSGTNLTTHKVREVNQAQVSALRERLHSYWLCLLPDNLEQLKPVAYPNLFLEFSSLQVSQTLKNCDKIFSVSDVKDHVEIWREVHANNILLAIHDVFSDFDIDKNMELVTSNEVDDVSIELDNESFWGETYQISETSSFLYNMEESVLHPGYLLQDEMDISDAVADIAEQINSKIVV